MIFVTTGTHHLTFDRLLRMISVLIKEISSSEEVIIQAGTSKIRFNGVKIVPFLAHQDFIDHLKKARIIITSAGPATIFQSLMSNKNMPIVVPRMKKYGEHVSDHQSYFAEYLSKKSLCKIIDEEEDLINLFKLHREEELLKERINLSSEKLTKSIKNYLESC